MCLYEVFCIHDNDVKHPVNIGSYMVYGTQSNQKFGWSVYCDERFWISSHVYIISHEKLLTVQNDKKGFFCIHDR